MTVDLMAMLRKRHADPSWCLLPEVANSTGGNVRRHADAVAFGIWPSRGYEIHGYELKATRADVQKELSDPTKAEAVGKYCDYWWLVVADLKIIDGLVIPEAWGVLAPKLGVLREHRKAPKQKASLVNRGFVAAIVRKVLERYVARDEHERVKINAKDIVREELQREREWKQTSMDHELAMLKQKIQKFREASGVDLESTTHWELGHIGKAVASIVEAQRISNGQRIAVDDLIDNQIQQMERAARQHNTYADGLREAKRLVEQLRDRNKGVAIEAPPDPPPEPPDALTAWATSVTEFLDGGGGKPDAG